MSKKGKFRKSLKSNNKFESDKDIESYFLDLENMTNQHNNIDSDNINKETDEDNEKETSDIFSKTKVSNKSKIRKNEFNLKKVHKKIKARMIYYFKKLKFVLSRKKDKFLKLFSKNKFSKEQLMIFEEIKIGELVFAEMDVSDSELYGIPIGHRSRPYIVVGKNKDSLICYPGSHSYKSNLEKMRIFRMFHTRNTKVNIRNNEIQNKVDSNIDLFKLSEIKIDQIKYFFMSPAEGELQRLQRQLEVVKYNYPNRKVVTISEPIIRFKEGDLVLTNFGVFFLYSVYNNDIYAHPAKNMSEANNSIKVGLNFGKKYIYIFEKIKIHRSDIIALIDYCSVENFFRFNDKKYRVINNTNKNNNKKTNKNTKIKTKNNEKCQECISTNNSSINNKNINFKINIGQLVLSDIDRSVYYYLFSIGKIMYGFSKNDIERSDTSINSYTINVIPLPKTPGYYECIEKSRFLDVFEKLDWSNFSEFKDEIYNKYESDNNYASIIKGKRIKY